MLPPHRCSVPIPWPDGRIEACPCTFSQWSLAYAATMNPPTGWSRRWRDPRASVRVAVAASLGIVAGVVASVWTFWQGAILIGWDVGALFLVTWIWWVVGGLDAEESKPCQ